MSIAGLLLNVLIIALLGVTITYCWLLNRRIRVLQDSKSELAGLLRHFDESTQRAAESIIALQTASKKIGENIQMRIDKANYMLDDLAFMIERGNKVANQIEAGFAVDRARNRVIAEQHTDAPEKQAEPVHTPPPPMEEYMPARASSDKAPSNREKTAASLEALLERVVGRSKQSAQENQPVPRPAQTVQSVQARSAARSRSEQELLEMIKTGIKG